MLSEDFYIYYGLDHYPKVIQDQINDRLAGRPRKPNEDEIVKEPPVIDMPFIKGDPNKKGPLIVTKDWFVKTKKKQLTRIAKEKKALQIEMMQLLGKRDALRIKLGRLDPGNMKDAKKIVSINITLRDIDATLSMLQDQSGIDLEELDHGTKFQRAVGRAKRAVGGFFKKVKKFFKKNKETIIEVASVAIPLAITLIFSILGTPAAGAAAATVASTAASVI